MKMQRSIFALFALVGTVFIPSLVHSQTISSFEGLDASQLPVASLEVDHNGAVGTKQYLEWVNSYYQAYDKTTGAAIWASPQEGDQPWINANLTNCYGTGGGEGMILFDRLASRWVIAKRAGPSTNVYYYCIAISNTDDLSSSSLAWFTYEFNISSNLGVNSAGNVYYPDWPKIGTWSDGYYASFDLEDPNNSYQEIGVVVCAFDRTNMIIGGTARKQQCFSNPSPIPTKGALYLSHSLLPADIDGTTAPKTGQHEFLVSILNPTANGKATTSTKINLWNFHVNWTTPTSSTFTHGTLTVPSYEPGCYDVSNPVNTFCVNEPSSTTTGIYIDSIGDRLEPRLAFRNLGTYSSFLFSHTVQVGTGTNQQTGIRWYELRGTTTPTLYQDGTVTNGTTVYRTTPSIAQDQSGNAAVGYTAVGSNLHPASRVSYWSLPNKTAFTELQIIGGVGDEENSSLWGNLSSMTVDPIDNCTFWYLNRYYQTNQTGTLVNFNTRIGNFKLSTCQ